MMKDVWRFARRHPWFAYAWLYCLFASLLSGCMASNLTEFAKALGQDPATVCFNLSTIYGQGKLYRTSCANCTVSCTQEGLSIHSP